MREQVTAVVAIVLVVGLTYLWWPRPARQATDGAPLVEVKVPPLSALQQAGEEAFAEKCAACHGDNAAGKDGSGPPLVHVIYEPNHHGDAAFFLAARNGVRQHHWRFGDMPPVEGIDDAEIEPIVAYVRRLQQANGIF